MLELDARIRRYYAYHGIASFLIWIPYWTLWLRRHLASDFELTLVDVFFWSVVLVLQVPAGVISDKYSRKWSLFLGEACKFLGLIGYALGTSFAEYSVANVVWAVGIVFLVSTESSFLYDTLAEFGAQERFAAVKGRATLLDFGASAAGSLAGGFALPVLGDRLDLVILLGAFLGMAGGSVTLLFREPRFARPRERAGLEQVREGYRAVQATPGLALLLLFNVVLGTTFTGFSILRAVYYSRIGVPDAWIGPAWAVLLTTGGIAAASAERVARRLGEARSMALLTALIGLPFLGVFVARDASPWVVLIQAPAYVGFGLSTPLLGAFINRRVTAAQRATVASLGATVQTMAVLLAEPFSGWLSTSTEIYAVGLAMGGSLLVLGGAIVVRWLARHPPFVPGPAPVGPSWWSRMMERFSRFRT